MREEWVDLAVRAKAWSMDAFEGLVNRFRIPLCAVIRPIVGNWHTTQDVAQDTFVVAWERIRGLRDPVSFRTWLFKIARNRAVTRLRSSLGVRVFQEGIDRISAREF